MPSLIKNLISPLTHLFFPHICSGCGTDVISNEQILCLQCIDRLPVTNFHMHANNPVEKIFWGRIPVANATSLLYFTKDSLFQHLLHDFKYKGKKEIGFYFGRMMGELFMRSNRFENIDILVPLPLYASKERRRGFNQATILCEGIAEVMQIPVSTNAISRIMATETQTHKSRTERWLNIEHKFQCLETSLIENKEVLLVDDVITTGATLESCGHELMKANNVRLNIATLGYTSA